MARFRLRVVGVVKAVVHLVEYLIEPGIAGFPFGERPEVGVRGQGKMVKTTGSTIFTIGIIAANVMLSCSTIIIIKITGVAAIDHSHHCNCNHCHHRRQCHHCI